MGLSFTSLVFETVNFVVLVWVLSRLVYRPLKRSLDERRAADELFRRNTESKHEEATRRLEELGLRSKEIVELRERAMREAAEDAAATRARLLGEARDDAASARAQGQKLFASERGEAMMAARELAIEQSTRIAARLLEELAPRGLDEALIERLADAVVAHHGSTRHELGPRRGVPEVQVRFARAPREEDVELLRAAFTKALGTTPSFTSSEDPSLVAGASATIGDRVLDASIAGNLAVLAARARELANGTAVDG